MTSYEPAGLTTRYDHAIYMKHQEVDAKIGELHRCELSIKLKMFLLGMFPYAKATPSDVIGWLNALDHSKDAIEQTEIDTGLALS